jgi:adenylate cyclase
MGFPVVAVRQPDRVPIFLSVQQPILLGRDCDGCVLVDPQVSRSHLQLQPQAGKVLVTDMGSTNGTFLDGERIDSPVLLMKGSVILAGETRLTLESSDDSTQVPSAAGRGTLIAGRAEIDRSATSSPGQARLRADRAAHDSLRATSIDIVAAAVREERPDLTALQDDAGTVTIVFSDIEGSTQRAVELGDIAWMKVLDEHNRIVREQVRAHGGKEIKSQGDGFMLSFPGARRAVLAMIEIQRSLTRLEERDPARSVRVRMGCHTGEVILDDVGDMFGKHVIVAARIANLADGGEILVSNLVKDLVSARGDVRFDESRRVELKGIDGTWDVHRVDWS